MVMCWELHEMRSELRAHRRQLRNRSADAESQRIPIAEMVTYPAVIFGTLCTFCLINYYLNVYNLECIRRCWSSLRNQTPTDGETILPSRRSMMPGMSYETPAVSDPPVETMRVGCSSSIAPNRSEERPMPDLTFAQASGAKTAAYSDTMRQRASRMTRHFDQPLPVKIIGHVINVGSDEIAGRSMPHVLDVRGIHSSKRARRRRARR